MSNQPHTNEPTVIVPAFIKRDYPFAWSRPVALPIGGQTINVNRPMLQDEDMRLFHAVVIHVRVDGDAGYSADLQGMFRVLFNTDIDKPLLHEKCREVMRSIVKQDLERQLGPDAPSIDFDKYVSAMVAVASDGRIATEKRVPFNVCLTSEELEDWHYNLCVAPQPAAQPA